MKKIVKENREIEGDISTLKMVADYTARLHCPHKDLDEINRQVSPVVHNLIFCYILWKCRTKSPLLIIITC